MAYGDMKEYMSIDQQSMSRGERGIQANTAKKRAQHLNGIKRFCNCQQIGEGEGEGDGD